MQRLDRVRAVPHVFSALTRIRAEMDPAKPVIVGIVGPSGAGKGHITTELIARLNADEGQHVTVLPLDNYYRGRTEMQRRKVPHFDHPGAVELDLAAAHLNKMRVGKRLDIPCYDFAEGMRVGMETCSVREFVVVDGLFALHAEVRPHLHYAMYLDTDVHSALLRRLFRDPGPMGRTQQSPRAVLGQYFREVVPSMREFIAPTMEHADVVVSSLYDGVTESARAGGMQFQCKAVAHLDDIEITQRTGAQRLGAVVRQTDRFLQPKGGRIDGEILRLRREGGDDFLTYKGPLTASDAGIGARAVTSPIQLDPGMADLFLNDYEVFETLSKLRTSFHAGDVIINRDSFSEGPIGNYIEVRALTEASAAQTRATLERLRVKNPYFTESYLDLSRKRRTSVRPAEKSAGES